MGRTKKSATLDNRSNRLKLDLGIRHQTPLAAGFYLAYRRPRSGQAGAWLARWKDMGEKVDKQSRLGDADDFTDADGIRILNYAQAQKKAEDWFKEAVKVLALEQGGEVVPIGPYTVTDAWADYLADARRRGVKGVKIMDQTAKAHILSALGDLHVGKLTRKEIEGWHEAFSQAPRRTSRKLREGEQPEEPKPRTQEEIRARRDSANRNLSNLKAALNYAAEQRKTTDAAPWREVKPFQKTTSQRVRFLTVAEQRNRVEIQRLLGEFTTAKYRMFFTLIYATGLRSNEARHLETRDIDSMQQVIHVRDGKGGKDRLVPMNGKLYGLLRAYYKQEQPAKPWLFASKAGNPICAETARRALLCAAAASGLERIAHV